MHPEPDFTFTPTDELRHVLSTVRAPVTLSSIITRWGAEPLGALIEAGEAALTLLPSKRYAVKWTGKVPEAPPSLDGEALRDKVRQMKRNGRTVLHIAERLNVPAGQVRAMLQGMRREHLRREVAV